MAPRAGSSCKASGHKLVGFFYKKSKPETLNPTASGHKLVGFEGIKCPVCAREGDAELLRQRSRGGARRSQVLHVGDEALE